MSVERHVREGGGANGGARARAPGFELTTTHVDAMHDALQRLLCPFDLHAHRRRRYSARLEHKTLGPLDFITLGYGAEVDIVVPEIAGFVLLQVPLAGSYRASSRDASNDFRPGGNGHVISPGAPLRMSCDSDSRMLLVRFDEAVVGAFASERDAAEPDRRRALPEAFPLASAAGVSLLRALDFLRDEAASATSAWHRPSGGHEAQRMTLRLLFEATGQGRVEPARDARPYYVKRAEAFMEANLGQDITLADVVRAAGVSTRTLYYGFQRRHGTAPMGWLRERRLERARAELLAADPVSVSVTEVAARWGFWHLGRFAATYRARYGEPPSRTLRG